MTYPHLDLLLDDCLRLQMHFHNDGLIYAISESDFLSLEAENINHGFLEDILSIPKADLELVCTILERGEDIYGTEIRSLEEFAQYATHLHQRIPTHIINQLIILTHGI